MSEIEESSPNYWKSQDLRKEKIDIIQINLGNKCNQKCLHCHIEASPNGNKNMEEETTIKIINKLITSDIKNIEFTGGAPELNSNLKIFIEKLSNHGKNITVRTNLTVLDLPQYSFYIELFKENEVKLIASLPSLHPESTDQQRGKNTFIKSIKVLKKLNEIGYGKGDLNLSLVYNPTGDYLPPEQTQLEDEYKEILKEKYDIQFNDLITIVNAPIKRFKNLLLKNGKLKNYMSLLREKYNPETLDKIMCRNIITIDYQGYLYDCDFNLALGKRIEGYENKRIWEIDFTEFNPRITCDEHCYACTVDQGSSCHGALIKSEKNLEDFDVKNQLKQYYGKELQNSSDLKTNACCSVEAPPENIKKALQLINDEIKMKYYGCGSPIPLTLNNLKVLDIGCGTGKDVYVMSYLVGEDGFVYGIDMTEEQLEVAKKYIEEHTKRFGFTKPNVKFILDYMENIEKHFKKESLDLVISNCVINLAEDKEIIVKQIFEALKWGGEFFFSDVYADRRAPDEIRKDPVLYSECLGGALYFKDFERIARKVGFTDPRIISKREIEITNPEIKKLVQNLRFYSITYRLWKIKGLEDACEDYGHIAIYKGGILETPFKFVLDNSHIFYRNKPEHVCGNTTLMLSQTRFNKYFEIIGSFKEHFGEFKECKTNTEEKDKSETCSCC